MTVQLKRTDLVRLAVERMREGIADEIRESAVAEVAAREKFRRAMMSQAGVRWNGVLSDACRMVGVDQDRLTIDVHLEMTDDNLAAPPAVVLVTIRDDELYAARLMLRLPVQVDDSSLAGWVAAVKRRQAAEARGVRAKDLDAEARALMVYNLMSGTESGRQVLAAMDRFLAESK